MSNFAILSTQLSKKYHIQGRRRRRYLRDRIRESLASSIGRFRSMDFKKRLKDESSTLWALRNVSFEIQRGESFGIIGPNGAGKTTLLKVLSRITAPTEGRIRLRGRVGSLLEVGTGFHAELTGRENVYLNGAVLGMKKAEIDRKFDEIVEFSGVEDFMDTPVKRYSSGMRMRLAFSVAAHLEPEILLVDEVLAVGDYAFQTKSLNKMEAVLKSGRTILFVSHNLGAVKALCPQSIYLDQGKVVYIGETDAAIDMYIQGNKTTESSDYEIDPSKHAQIYSIYTSDNNGESKLSFGHDQPVHIRIKVNINVEMFRPTLSLNLHNADLDTIMVSSDFEDDGRFKLPGTPGSYEFQVCLPANFLVPGRYFLSAEIAKQTHRGTMRRMHRLEHSAEFEIYDNGSIRSQFNIPWKGWVHTDVEWKRVA